MAAFSLSRFRALSETLLSTLREGLLLFLV